MNQPHSWHAVTVTEEFRRDSAIDPDKLLADMVKEKFAKHLMELMEIEVTWERYGDMAHRHDPRLPPPVGTEPVDDDWAVVMTARLPGFKWPSNE